MLVFAECKDLEERMYDYLDEALPKEERLAFESHLKACSPCREGLKRFRAVRGLIQGTLGSGIVSEGFKEKTGRRLQEIAPTFSSKHLPVGIGPKSESDQEAAVALQASTLDRLGAAPWWMVSVALHVLVILLLGLITMSIGLQENTHSVIVLTSLEKMAAVKPEEEAKKNKPDIRDVLEKRETPATDPTSTLQSNIVVPPEILAKAELGDHFETINLDRPDTQSAFGNPEARMFHSASGNDEPEGGGGLGGNSLMDDLIGMGGSNSPGSGGGWGGGHGTGTGIGNGAGHGSFGQRGGGGRKLMVMKHGGGKATESAVEAALEWLARNQEKDGHWNPSRHGSSSNGFDVGLTGLATLAFLGAGHSTKVGKYKDNVKRAVEWMVSQQGDNGDFNAKQPVVSFAPMYNHCIATLACAEAFAMSGGMGKKDASWGEEAGGDKLKGAVQRGIELILKWQNQNSLGGWTYYTNPCFDQTLSAWAVMALKSAKVCGFTIPGDSFKRASEGMQKLLVVDKTKGSYGHAMTGYGGTGGRSMEFDSRGNVCTGATMMGLLFMGGDRDESGAMAAGEYLTQTESLPKWNFNPQNNGQTLYAWYYGSLGCFQLGGEIWKRWNEQLKAALLPHQCKGGDNDGSWDPLDLWGSQAGRVYSTALGALCLEVYYRYLPIQK